MNIKKCVILGLVLLSAGCGQDGRNGFNGSNGSNGANAPTNASILSSFTNTDSTSRVPSLDFSQLTLNSVQSLAPALDCNALLNGQPDESGNSPAVNGVGKNQVQISGSTTSGIIQFGPLSHADHNLNDVCYTIGQEEYSYEVSGNMLTLCDIKYSSCSTFTTGQ